tara:strand:- start:885 stop:1172 length:288 start_codon:yes stop_codon:yes gene_type:complete
MSKKLELELRIETIIVSWIRNAIILITLAVAIKNFAKEKMTTISNLLILLSIIIIIYIYKRLDGLKKHFNKNKLNKLYFIISILFFISILVLYNI